MIPRQLHFIWIGSKLPNWAEDNIRMFGELNPSFGVHLHGEEVLLPEFREAYDAIAGEHVYARKSDLLRVSVLLASGGWYWDTDFLPIRPIEELYTYYNDFPKHCFVTHGAFLRGRRWIANGIIGTSAGSPFILKIYDGILRNARQKESRWETYGPGLYTETVEQYPELVHVGLLDDFYRLQERRRSIVAYKRIRRDGFSQEAIVRELGEPLPMAMHMSMQDEVRL